MNVPDNFRLLRRATGFFVPNTGPARGSPGSAFPCVARFPTTAANPSAWPA